MSGRSCWRPAGSAWTRPATGSCWDTRGEWPQRLWAVEGANGTGRPLAARLLADGEYVVDVPAKLAARIRSFDVGHGRKSDATDAHAITMAALRTRGLRQLTHDEDLAVLRLLADRRDELSRTRAQTLNRLHRRRSQANASSAPTASAEPLSAAMKMVPLAFIFRKVAWKLSSCRTALRRVSPRAF